MKRKAYKYNLGSWLSLGLGKMGILLQTGSRIDNKQPIYSGLTDMGKGLIGGISTAFGLVGGNLIGGGLDSSAADITNSIGSTVGGVVSSFNPLVGNLITAGSGLVSGLTRRFTGYSVDKEGLARLLQYLNMLNNLQVDDSSNASVADAFGSVNLGGVNLNRKKYKNGWFNNKGTLAYNKDIALETAATLRGLATLENASLNADTTMDLNLMANFAEEGGKIHIKKKNRGKFTQSAENAGMGVLEFARHVLANKDDYSSTLVKRANFARNAKSWKHSFGGGLETHGSNFNNNGFIFIDNGGTHEANPYEGVQIGIDLEGIPNLVEEGEVLFNDYVFSNKLKPSKQIKSKYSLGGDLTYADAVKKMLQESEERPNDLISKNGVMSWIGDFMMELEMQRYLKENSKFANGGKVNRFDWGGNSWSWGDNFKYLQNGKYDLGYLDFVNSLTLELIDNAMTNKPELFSRFRAKNPDYKVTVDNAKAWATDFKPSDFHKFMGYLYENQDILSSNSKDNSNKLPLSKAPSLIPILGTGKVPYAGPENPMITDTNPKLYKHTDNTENLTLDYPAYDHWMRYAPLLGNAIGLGLTAFSKPDYSSADAILEASKNAGRFERIGYRPIGDYLAYNPLDRDYYLNKFNAISGANRRAILNASAGNIGSAMAGLLASDYNAMGQTGDMLMKMDIADIENKFKSAEFDRATNQYNSNMGIGVDEANAKLMASANDSYLKGVMASEQLRLGVKQAKEQALTANITGLFDNLGAIGLQNVYNQQYKWALEHGVGAPSYAKNGGKLKRKKGFTI